MLRCLVRGLFLRSPHPDGPNKHLTHTFARARPPTPGLPEEGGAIVCTSCSPSVAKPLSTVLRRSHGVGEGELALNHPGSIRVDDINLLDLNHSWRRIDACPWRGTSIVALMSLSTNISGLLHSPRSMIEMLIQLMLPVADDYIN